MDKLPASLAISLWAIGSLFLVAFLAYLFDAPEELVWTTIGVGAVAAAAEWRDHKEKKQ